MNKNYKDRVIIITCFLFLVLVCCQDTKKKIDPTLLGLSLPVKVIHAGVYKDGGTIGVKFQDYKGETLTVFLQQKPREVYNNKLNVGKGVLGIISKKNGKDSSINNNKLTNRIKNDKLYDSIEFRKSCEKYFKELNKDEQKIDKRNLYIKRVVSDSLLIEVFEQNGQRENAVIYLLEEYLKKEYVGKTEWELHQEWFKLFCSPDYSMNDIKVVELRNAIDAYRMLNLLRLRNNNNM